MLLPGRQAGERKEEPEKQCLCFGSIPKPYFGRRRACGEIWVEAETLGRLPHPGTTMVVLAVTANVRPVVQWFSSIVTLVMDVTGVSLLRQHQERSLMPSY